MSQHDMTRSARVVWRVAGVCVSSTFHRDCCLILQREAEERERERERERESKRSTSESTLVGTRRPLNKDFNWRNIVKY